MKYIFCEMDFFLSHYPITRQMCTELERARMKGNNIYLCTLRNKGSLKCVQHLGFNGLIASAGAYVQAGSQVLCNESLSIEDVYKIEAALNGLGIKYQLETQDLVYQDVRLLKDRLGKLLIGADVSVQTGKRIQKYKNDEGIASLNKYHGEPVHKIGFVADKVEKIRQIEKAYGQDYKFVYLDDVPQGIHGEIRPKYLSLRDGISQILKYEGASSQDAIALVELNDPVGLKDALPHVIVMDQDVGKTISHLI